MVSSARIARRVCYRGVVFAGCRCPRCDDVVLTGKELERAEVLACRRCGGGFVSAAVGLRLLAMLQPEVAPVDEDAPRAACPVCRKPMKLVITGAAAAMDTCAQHGVWFDAGDLPIVVRAVAKALGKPVPDVVGQLEAHAGQRRPEVDQGPSAPASGSASVTPSPPLNVVASGAAGRTSPRSSAATDAAFGVVDTVGDVVGTAATVVAFPFQLTLATVELLTEIVD